MLDEKQETFSDSLKLSNPYVLVATFFGCGLIPFAPGTWGSFAGLLFAIFVISFFGGTGLIMGLAVICVMGVWSIGGFQKETNTHDSSVIVIDEVAGMFLTLIAVQSLLTELTVMNGIAAFVLFRFFDILKPWPISAFDNNIKSAAGVLGDDLFAAFYAALSIMGLNYLGYL